MAFNHYAKIKRLLSNHKGGWYIRLIKKPTQAKTFKGELRKFDHYYRIYDDNDKPIKYCKFQQLELFYRTMNISSGDILIIEDDA